MPVATHASVQEHQALMDVARGALEAARKAGADQAEACVEQSASVSARAEQNDLSGAEASESTAMGLRVLVNGAVGFASANRMDPQALSEAAARAVALARAGQPEPGLMLPGPEPLEELTGMTDPAAPALTVTAAVDACHALLAALQGVDARISVDMAAASFTRGTRVVANSQGVMAVDSGTGASVAAVALATHGEDVTGMDSEDDTAIRAAALDPAALGRLLGARLLTQLGARGWDGPAEGALVLSPEAFLELLLDPLLAGMHAESVRLGTSALMEKQGKPVAAPLLTLWDDPLAHATVGAEAFDREGVPRVRRALVADGVLQGWLHNTLSAFRMKAARTGHAGGAATGIPGVGVGRLVVTPGAASAQDLVQEAGEGVYVARFSGVVDEVSGDFSGVAKCSFRIRAGKLAEPLKETTLSGNAHQTLMEILALGRDHRRVGSSMVPHALVHGVTVSGG